MSLNFAAITPHPPIIVPGIGSSSDLQKVVGTVSAMKKLANDFREAEIDTCIVISPHTLVYPDRFNVCGMKKLFGSFAPFGAPDIMMEYQNNQELAREIDERGNKAGFKTLLYDNDGEFFELDHGIMVPMFYLGSQLESALKIIPLAYSNLDRASHFDFGKVLGEIIKSYPGRIGVIASGDLSHRLIQGVPGGFSEAGKEFDKKITSDIKENNVKEILYYDEDFVEDAGECGYRSILILLGVLDGTNAKVEVLSYEGPFGVGYLVANYKIETP